MAASCPTGNRHHTERKSLRFPAGHRDAPPRQLSIGSPGCSGLCSSQSAALSAPAYAAPNPQPGVLRVMQLSALRRCGVEVPAVVPAPSSRQRGAGERPPCPGASTRGPNSASRETVSIEVFQFQVVYQGGPDRSGDPSRTPRSEFKFTVTTASPVIRTPSLERQ